MPGADGNYSPAAAAARMDLRAKHMADLTPLMRAQAKRFQDATTAAFSQQRSPAGEQWPKLAESTLKGRARSRSTGAATSTGKPFRRAAARPGAPSAFGTIALVKTRTMLRTTKYVPTTSTIKLETVPYMGPHQSGAKNGRPPKRNPLVYEKKGGQLVLVAPFNEQFRAAFIAYVETGKVA